jgi:hypothetical protein
MTAPKRIQRKRTKGWRMPEGAVYVGRGTAWGNPYKAGPGVARMPWLPDGAELTTEQCVAYYREMMVGGGPNLLADKWLTPRIGAIRHFLRGKDLACWCPLDQPCHADVLLELANGGAS